MGKSDEDVISQFNGVVNMTASELEEWLETEDSKTAGQVGESGESKGHESGRQILDILQRNPGKDPEQYTEDDLSHMRRVVAYCGRHLAQEDKLKESKSPEELEDTKSTKSLKNWGQA